MTPTIRKFSASISFSLLTVAFMNCGSGGFEDRWGPSSASLPSVEEPDDFEFLNTEEPPSEVDYSKLSFLERMSLASFKAGDPLNPEDLPVDTNSLSVSVEAYFNSPGYKAIALSEDGKIYLDYSDASSSSVSLTQMESNRKALEGCFTVSVGKECAIFAEKIQIKYNAQDFVDAMQASTLPGLNSQYVASEVPWVSNAARAGALKSYATFENHKSLSIGISGAGCFRRGHSSEAEAVRQAVQCCEWVSRGQACVTYAVGNVVAFDITKHLYPDSISFSFGPGKLNYDQIPFVSDAARTLLKSSLAKSIQTTSTPVALALNGEGDWAFRTGASVSDAKAAALQACSESGPGGECLVYSVGDEVVLTLKDLQNY